MNKLQFKIRLPLILAAVIFGLAAFDAFANQYIGWGLFNLVITIANLIALKYSEKHPELTTVFLSILNAAAAFLTAWVFIEEGKQYIQFVWILTGVVYLVVSYLFSNKAQKKYL